MYGAISVVIIIICVLLIGVVLVQNSKGGGLAANFAASTQVMGVRRTADFLEKATWILATSLLVLALLSSALMKKPQELNESKIKNQVENSVDPNAFPNPVSAPASTNSTNQTQKPDAQQQNSTGQQKAK